MKFDKYGRRVQSFSNVSSFDGLTPEINEELRRLGIENSSIRVILDISNPEKSVAVFKMILKIAKAQQ